MPRKTNQSNDLVTSCWWGNFYWSIRTCRTCTRNYAKVATELGVSSIDTVMYAWLLAHPANMMPIVGSGKLDRVKRPLLLQTLT